ncbi:uncharacterized protein LOC143178513 [Calliopsis andreniformis]|uniref:uncharacterized protein LOC143178513 n=1 Tax=Calliopsis andreniformis TaxID=337506 RepID=UPI003FCE2CB9
MRISNELFACWYCSINEFLIIFLARVIRYCANVANFLPSTSISYCAMGAPSDGISKDKSTSRNHLGGIRGVIVGLIHEGCQHDCSSRLCPGTSLTEISQMHA